MSEAPARGLARLRIEAAGAVQGVGFRPFVFRLAESLGLAGWVGNTASGAVIEVEGAEARIEDFRARLQSELPSPAMILAMECAWIEPLGDAAFRIEASGGGGAASATILPDLAPCEECLAEMRNPSERRFQYPFTNCTRCGPRFTIVTAIPYDRPNTTMSGFALCGDCEREYSATADRRFHAQPIACPECGPVLRGEIGRAAESLAGGEIVALKGVGGFQLLCDARNGAAVARLRERKHREWKPLAVMAASVEQAREYARVSDAEASLLGSPAAPIVLLEAVEGTGLASEVRRGSPWLGVMLPSSPLHHLLMDAFPAPVVCTSGNLSDEPIATGNEEARERLGGVADVFVEHNRPIARGCDDSLARVTGGRVSLMRRARGYAPLPVWVGGKLPRVLAAGAHLKNTVALAVGRQVVVSQHIGDLETPEAREAFLRAISDLCVIYSFKPDLVACDLHPDYFSSIHAASLGIPLKAIQHHHAHAASVIAENGLSGAVLAVCWDGTGLGLDQTVWGGEMFVVDGARFTRVGHLAPFLLPGGDAAMKDCRRPAAGILDALGRPSVYSEVLKRRVNCVETTSVGRLFDAFACFAGLTERNHFEGAAGLLLEAAAMRDDSAASYPLVDGDWRQMAEEFIERPSPRRFHNALVDWILHTALKTGVKQVALSGGCFQNALLTRLVIEALEGRGIRVATHQRVPANDGGISLGQAVLAGGEYEAVQAPE